MIFLGPIELLKSTAIVDSDDDDCPNGAASIAEIDSEW